MNIAHIVSSYPPYYGGMGNVVFHIAQGQLQKGHTVEVFTPAYYQDQEIRPADAQTASNHSEQLQEDIARVNRIAPQLQYGNAARLSQIGTELDNFDVVHLHYPFFGTANLVRKWKLRNPHKTLVITYHMDARASDWKGLVFKLYAKWWMPKILDAADVLIGSSFDFIENSEAASLYMKHPEKWLEIPFGVDIERFKPQPKPEDMFADVGLDPNIPTVVFVGGMDRAHYFKGVEVLIDALGLIKANTGDEIQAVLAGDGDMRFQYEERARYMGLEQVRFLGFVDDAVLPNVYAMGDVFVLPSINQAEAFGLVLLEAMATGVPVLGSDLPGVRSVAQNGGELVRPKDPMHLAEMLLGFVELPVDQKIDWKSYARIMAEDKYSWDHVVDMHLLAYDQLVNKQ